MPNYLAFYTFLNYYSDGIIQNITFSVPAYVISEVDKEKIKEIGPQKILGQ